MIRISEVRVGEAAERRVLSVLRSGRLVQGPMVAEFEERFAKVAGVPYAIAVSSGTTALVAAIEALGIGPGDEVITSQFTFVATLNAILEAGATAVLVDVLAADLTIDPARVEEAIGPRTRAVMPVHLFGYPADMDHLVEIARRHDLAIIEDAAQAHNATVGGRPVGSFGLGTFSFYATKNLSTGEGGMVTTADPTIADRLRLLRSQGMRDRYNYEIVGHNYRMTELQAALGVCELEQLDWVTERRRAHAAVLSDGLAGLEGVTVPAADEDRGHVFHQFTIRVSPAARISRDALKGALLDREIETGIYYPRPVFDYPCYLSLPSVRVEHAVESRRAATEVLSLPVHQWLDTADVERVVSSVRELLRP